MSTSHFIRLGKIKAKNGVLVALKHNKRTLQAEHGTGSNIDFNRTPSNYALAGLDTPENIAKHARKLMFEAGIEKTRANGVMAVEIIFSLPINRHNQDTSTFFTSCHDWVMTNIDGVLLSFDIHLDEAAPHAHAIILPLINGRMQGSTLVGGTGNLKRLINLFHQEVGCHFGLSRGVNKKLNPLDRKCLTKDVLFELRSDPAMESAIWSIIRDLIEEQPLRFAQLLSISSSQKPKIKDFVDIKRSRGKGTFIT